MVRTLTWTVGILLTLGSVWACSPEPWGSTPTSHHPAEMARPEVTQAALPFSFRVDPETCAQDEAVDIERALYGICGRSSNVVGLSMACSIQGSLVIGCEPVEDEKPFVCSRTEQFEVGSESIRRIVVAQTEDGRIASPEHASRHGLCPSLSRSLEQELQALAAFEAKKPNLTRN